MNSHEKRIYDDGASDAIAEYIGAFDVHAVLPDYVHPDRPVELAKYVGGLQKTALAVAMDQKYRIGVCSTCGTLHFPAQQLWAGAHTGHDGSVVEADSFNDAVRNGIGVIMKAKASLS